MSPTFGPFSKFSGRWGKSSHVFEQWANTMLKNLKLILLCFLHYSSIPQNELRLKPHNFNCCECLLVTVCLDRICVVSCMLDHLTLPMGQVVKTQLFGEHHFKGFCENVVFLVLPRICSQKIKDSQSILTIKTPCLAMNERARKR